MKHYFNLIKPNIVIGNAISTIGGFLVASKNHIIYFPTFINMLIGTLLVISASCVLNNIIDCDIDAIMERTQHRVLAKSQKIFSIKKSILYALVLGIFGFLFLSFTKNLLIICLASIGLFVYIGIYSIWMKRKSIYSIIIGSISGSMPPIIGYCTVTNTIDTGAITLLTIFSFWQISHSYAITIFRFNDYKAAAIPTFPIIKGITTTIHHILIYIFGYILAIMLLTITGYTSYTFLLISSSINILWLYEGFNGYKYTNSNVYLWAKKMFLLSIIVIMFINFLFFLDYCLTYTTHVKI